MWKDMYVLFDTSHNGEVRLIREMMDLSEFYKTFYTKYKKRIYKIIYNHYFAYGANSPYHIYPSSVSSESLISESYKELLSCSRTLLEIILLDRYFQLFAIHNSILLLVNGIIFPLSD